MSAAQANKARSDSRDQIAYRLETGQWRQVAHGVYVVAGAPMALGTEGHDRLPGRARGYGRLPPQRAAALFGLAKAPSRTAGDHPARSERAVQGRDDLPRTARTGRTCVRKRIPCTSPTRTIVDCAAAGLVEGEALWDLVDSALCKKLMQPSRLVERQRAGLGGRPRRAAASPRTARTGARRLALGGTGGEPTGGELQRKLIEWGFPRAERQVEVVRRGREIRRPGRRRDPGTEGALRVRQRRAPRASLLARRRRPPGPHRGTGLDGGSVDRFDLRPSNTRLRTEAGTAVERCAKWSQARQCAQREPGLTAA